MKKSRYTEAQIVGFIKEADAGMPVAELCRRHGFSDASFYKWRAKYGGLQASDVKRLREVETENSRLKKLLAEVHLDIEALKQAFGVKRLSYRLSARRSRGCWNRASFRSAGVSSGGVIQGQLAPSAAGDGGGNRLAGNHHHPRPATPPVWLSPHP